MMLKPMLLGLRLATRLHPYTHDGFYSTAPTAAFLPATKF